MNLKVKKLSFEEIINQNSQRTDLFNYLLNPKIFILDFINLEEQGTTMNRLACFIEKTNAPKNYLLDDNGLDKFIKKSGDTQENFYFGHNYFASNLVKFFRMAKMQKINLSLKENWLKKILRQNGFFNKQEKILKPEKFLITLTQKQPKIITLEKRRIILKHELSHAKYFFDSKYQQYCYDFWYKKLNVKDRNYFLKFLQRENYDVNNINLVINEMQAYLIHTPIKWFSSGINLSIERLRQLRKNFTNNISNKK